MDKVSWMKNWIGAAGWKFGGLFTQKDVQKGVYFRL
jgi:hypothetical protein